MNLLMAVLGLGPFALMAGGIAIIWWASGGGYYTGTMVSPAVVFVRAAGWSVFLSGVAAFVILTTHGLAIVALIATTLVVLRGVFLYFDAERRSLLWVLATAAERGIPLDTAARAFAEEHHNRIGQRAAQLADYLEAGVPLGLALVRSRNRVSHAAMLAADMGLQTGNLGPALRRAIGEVDVMDASLHAIIQRLFYLVFLVLFSVVMLSYLLVRILPVLQRMFREFDIPLPAPSQWLINAMTFLSDSWPLTIMLAFVIVVAVAAGLWHEVGGSTRSWPVFRNLWWRADCALVMRWLATAIRQQRPLNDFLRLLASYFPQPKMRARLEQAAQRIERGDQWCESLRRARIIRPNESALFQAAERVGNLPWALEEMADSTLRCAAWRLRARLQVAFPLILLLCGAGVFSIALGILFPLIRLIEGLT